jgi:NitT/TauT family transport system ATP-binding protein
MARSTTAAPVAETTDLAVHIDRVGKTFGAAGNPPVLSDVTLEVPRGEFVAIVGPSGCGKTTLLRIIQGLDHATSGRVNLAAAAPGRAARMSYVFQRATLLPWYSVRKNVAFGVDLAAGRRIHSATARAEAVDELLEMTGLSRYADYLPSEISGGMQQRANVARALAVRPDVLLLDEPFSALDALTRERLQVDVARILGELGTTAILVTHDIREAVFMADRVAVMAAHPGVIRRIMPMDEPRPRTPEYQQSPELAEIQSSVWRELHH